MACACTHASGAPTNSIESETAAGHACPLSFWDVRVAVSYVYRIVVEPRVSYKLFFFPCVTINYITGNQHCALYDELSRLRMR